ncbi:hypothetical protein BgiBS90_021997, partial [Biomphalaria glabrata]
LGTRDYTVQFDFAIPCGCPALGKLSLEEQSVDRILSHSFIPATESSAMNSVP